MATVQRVPADVRGRNERILDWVERLGNRLPDPAMHFAIAIAGTMASSALLAGRDFGIIDPRSGRPLEVINQLGLPLGVQGVYLYP